MRKILGENKPNNSEARKLIKLFLIKTSQIHAVGTCSLELLLDLSIVNFRF